MVAIHVETELDAPPAVVWADVRHIPSHVEWMHDAESIWFTSTSTEGAGTSFECETKVGPIRLTDVMEITEWVDEQAMGVRHSGVVTGEGVFRLEPLGANRTVFSWREELNFPWWLGGPIGERIGAVVLRAIWKRNLGLLRSRFRDGARI